MNKLILLSLITISCCANYQSLPDPIIEKKEERCNIYLHYIKRSNSFVVVTNEGSTLVESWSSYPGGDIEIINRASISFSATPDHYRITAHGEDEFCSSTIQFDLP